MECGCNIAHMFRTFKHFDRRGIQILCEQRQIGSIRVNADGNPVQFEFLFYAELVETL